MKRLLYLILGTLLMTAMPPLSAAPHAQSRVRVRITSIEMSRTDVARLSITTLSIHHRRDDLQAVINAAHRVHASFVKIDGPTITASTGKSVAEGGVTITPLSVRDGRAYVRVGVVRHERTLPHRTRLTHIITANHLYRSGETRRLAGVRQGNGHYRYTFATVTVL